MTVLLSGILFSNNIKFIYAEEIEPLSTERLYINFVFNSYIDIEFKAKSENVTSIKSEITSIVQLLNALTDNFNTTISPYEEYANVFDINNSFSDVLIDDILFDIFTLASEINIYTNEYYNIGIGKIIDNYKNLIANRFQYEINDSEYQNAKQKSLEVDITETKYVLFEEDNKKYISLKSDTLLDLGSIAKGYAVDEIKKILSKYEVTDYFIDGGSSSMAIGNYTRTENGYASLGLSSPYLFNKNYKNYPQIAEYANITIRNKSIATSNYGQQYGYYKNNIVSHIISPKTKEPVNNMQSVTLIGDDACLLDAFSTAIYTMTLEEALVFSKKILQDYNIETLILDNNLRVHHEFSSDSNYNLVVNVTEISENQFSNWFKNNFFYIIIVVIIIVMICLYLKDFFKSRKSKSIVSNNDDDNESETPGEDI
jgi:thiamine biosynthesis lipoprotein